ncbi:radical SAM family heme chaperone HemW [Entomospira entomophila]|uniref:Heme chaperone HemW n=1 Tax=Entomospira entomophila TaxID=2719988 RepID=A0A968KSB2_9SPIO|nr:radical SAM family heme chaperone HemW [Entomospira entomophilus]NIZ40157.1 radical SAM family heme chaperone HemW [Entomospira entomophilus]WDI35715.1 radical SAM family heme chaperone HemW [Entomospira entomophilus]
MIEVNPLQLDHRQEYALYVHIPFCWYKCHYCDFFSSVGVQESLRIRVIERIITEIPYQLQHLGVTQLSSVYIGGGTPSLLTEEQVSRLLNTVQGYQPQQITIEMNPEDITPLWLNALKLERWSNVRLSMGIQTFHQASLSAVGRNTTLEQTVQSLQYLESYKHRLNLDLIAGLPYHTEKIVRDDMHRLLEYNPSHISLYSLAMEQGTILTHRNHPYLPTEEDRSIQWQISQELLQKAGYVQYEISNYARDIQDRSRQNLHYWQLKPYIGIGPGAVGTLVYRNGSAVRVSGKKSLQDWSNPDKHDLWEYETVDQQNFLFEHYMMGLRTVIGVDKVILEQRFGAKGIDPWRQLEQSKWRGYMQESQTSLVLSAEGRLFLDSLLLDLIDLIDLCRG